MIDTHTHLYPSSFGEDAYGAIRRALEAGVSHLILPNIDEESLSSIKDIHEKFPKETSIAMGLHPTDLGENPDQTIDMMEEKLSEGGYTAIGEIGMDLYWDKSRIEDQKRIFARQLQIAERKGLPVIIHSREALNETLDIIKKVNPTVSLIFHSFTGSKNDVKEIRKSCDPYFGINGVVTYKNATSLREALPEIGLNKIILETDSPYLTPVPHRGKKNESAYLCYIRDKIAEILSVNPKEVEDRTDQNAKEIFRI